MRALESALAENPILASDRAPARLLEHAAIRWNRGGATASAFGVWNAEPARRQGSGKRLPSRRPNVPYDNRNKSPCSEQKNSLFRAKKFPVMGAKIPCYF